MTTVWSGHCSGPANVKPRLGWLKLRREGGEGYGSRV